MKMQTQQRPYTEVAVSPSTTVLIAIDFWKFSNKMRKLSITSFLGATCRLRVSNSKKRLNLFAELYAMCQKSSSESLTTFYQYVKSF